jgi:hypothetical protein
VDGAESNPQGPATALVAPRRHRSSTAQQALFVWMRRYRLIDEETGTDLGPFVSHRAAFHVGEQLARIPDERYVLVNVVAAENENFRAYLVVTQLREDDRERQFAENNDSGAPSDSGNAAVDGAGTSENRPPI